MLFYGVIFICMGAISASECSYSNALEVREVPHPTPTALACLMQAQEYAATAHLPEGDTFRIACARGKPT